MTFELNQDEINQRVANLPAVREVPAGVFDNFFSGTGRYAMQGLAKTGRAIDLLGAVAPIVRDKITGGTEAQTQYFKEHDEVFGRAVDYWTPKPNEVGAAGQVVGQLLGTLPQVFASPALAIGSAQLSTGEDLINQGVSAGKAQAAGAVQAAGLGLGIWMPILGKTLAQRTLLGGAGFNVAQGMATRAATGAVLSDTPAAQDYKAMDGTGITLDALLGLAFGGLAHITHGMDAKQAAPFKELAKKIQPSDADAIATMRQAQHLSVDSMPGKPVDVADQSAHVALIREAIDSLASDKPVSLEDRPQPRFEVDPVRQTQAQEVIQVMQEQAAHIAEAEGVRPIADAPVVEQPSSLDPWSQPQPARTLDQLLTDENVRAELEYMKTQTGWAQWGGNMIRDPDTGEVTGRTPWIPKASWWPDRPKGLIEGHVIKAVNKALAGEKLKAAETRIVDYMAGVADQEIKSRAYKPLDDELVSFDLRPHNAIDVAMTARAVEINSAAVEDLAVRFESDDAGFMRSIKGLLDEHDAKNTGSSQEGSGTQNQAAEANQAAGEASQKIANPLADEAARFARENPDTTLVVGRNADDTPITTTPAKLLDEADVALQRTQDDVKLLDIAAACLLGAA